MTSFRSAGSLFESEGRMMATKLPFDLYKLSLKSVYLFSSFAF